MSLVVVRTAVKGQRNLCETCCVPIYVNMIVSILAFRFQVLCNNDSMTVVFARQDLPGDVNIDRLYFSLRSCKAGWNSTHVIAKAPLTGCGTVSSKTKQALFYKNILSEEGQGRGMMPTDHLFRVNLNCTYPRKRTVGSFSFAPAKQRMVLSVGE